MKNIYKYRLEKIIKYLIYENMDGIIIFNPSDILYLSGFNDKEKNSLLLITKDRFLFFTDGRFINQFNNQVSGFELIQFYSQFNKFITVNNKIKELNINKIIFDFDDLSYQDILDLNIENLNIKNCSGKIKSFRRTKSIDEIQNIKKACKISENAFLKTLDYIHEGITEIEIQNILNDFMYTYGSQRPAFPTIIASGPTNGALPHAIPTNRKIKKGEFITIDFGATYNNYSSDITRTIALGEVSKEMKDIYDITLFAKKESEKLLKPGVSTNKIHKCAEKIINKNGFKFLHGLGHGIGLEIHELPTINNKYKKELKINDIHTIEPGIYVPGLCGVRIEDDYLIKKDGYEILTPNITTDLIIL